MTLSMNAERALAITPKCTSSLATACNVFLLYEIYCDRRTKGTTAIQRTIVGMTVIDILSCFAWFLSSWAVPRGSFALSAGNRASCNFQGFLLQLAIGAPLYNCSLALYYILVLKYRWTEKQLEGIEKWVHAAILSFAVGTSILLLPLGQYNATGAVCWVIGEPDGCSESRFESSGIPCERGKNAWIYGLTLFYGPLWLCVVACVSSMAMIYREVRRTIKRLERYSISGVSMHSGRSTNDSLKVATQAILYSLSFLFTWMPSTLWSIAHWFSWTNFYLDFAAGFCEPLQGLWNMLIFARTRASTKRKIFKLLHEIMPCWCSFNEEDYIDHVSGRRGTSMRQSHMSNNIPTSENFRTGVPDETEETLDEHAEAAAVVPIVGRDVKEVCQAVGPDGIESSQC